MATPEDSSLGPLSANKLTGYLHYHYLLHTSSFFYVHFSLNSVPLWSGGSTRQWKTPQTGWTNQVRATPVSWHLLHGQKNEEKYADKPPRAAAEWSVLELNLEMIIYEHTNRGPAFIPSGLFAPYFAFLLILYWSVGFCILIFTTDVFKRHNHSHKLVDFSCLQR